MLTTDLDSNRTSVQWKNAEGKVVFSIVLNKTLRVPDDGRTYPLPPGLGRFQFRKVEDYRTKVPAKWLEQGGVFTCLSQAEAAWISFQNAEHWRPKALKVAAGMINAISGASWSNDLQACETRGGKKIQDYCVTPPQPWLDGFKTDENTIRQLVAMPLGQGYTVEGQVTGKEKFGGLQIIVFEPKAGKFPDAPPPSRFRSFDSGMESFSLESAVLCAAPMMKSATRGIGGQSASEMGLAAGGRIKQEISEDPHGLDTWDQENYGRVFIHVVNSTMWEQITGEKAPASQIDARTYSSYGFPWFDYYGEGTDVATSDTLSKIQSIAQIDEQKGVTTQDNTPVAITNVKKIGKVPPTNLDGTW